jgi:hypothetical protein
VVSIAKIAGIAKESGMKSSDRMIFQFGLFGNFGNAAVGFRSL